MQPEPESTTPTTQTVRLTTISVMFALVWIANVYMGVFANLRLDIRRERRILRQSSRNTGKGFETSLILFLLAILLRGHHVIAKLQRLQGPVRYSQGLGKSSTNVVLGETSMTPK